MHPPAKAGGVVILEFGGGQNIFDFRREGLYFFGGGQFILCPFSQFQKISKFFACGALIFNIHIFRFKLYAGLQIDIDFNTESNSLVQGAVSFHPSMDTQNQPNMKLLSFLST